ncbi:MAG: AAA family ATPase [Clostridia bacterium]|nr:AAA family ATPase [Clostridia bacterium]
MDELESFVKFIKEKFSENEIKMARFIHETDLLTYTMLTDKVKEGDRIVEKPTNVLELSYLKLCAKKFDDSDNLLEKLFLFYVGYSLREFKNTWKLNLNNLDNDLAMKCSYCNIDSNVCPFKLVSYIKKCIADNKFNSKRVFDLLGDRGYREYSKDQYFSEYVVKAITELVKNNLDLIGAEMLLNSDAIKIEKEEDGKIYYRYIDFNVRDNSFFNNLNDFYKYGNGLWGEFNLSEIKFQENISYIFDKSPIEIAVYIRYLCEKNNLDELEIIKKILKDRKFKDSEFRIAYYNQYVHAVKELECGEKEKEEIISILTYIRNYYFNEDLPYIHFNIALFTKNNMISDKVINIINRYVRTFNYVTNKGTLWVDAEMITKRTKDSTDMIMQIDKIYSDNDVVIFENFNRVKTLNEFRVDALFTAIEKFNSKNRRSITFIIGDENILNDTMKKHPEILDTIVNKKIWINGFDVLKIKEKVINRLENIMKIDDEFSEDLEKYISITYHPETVDEYTYIENVYNLVVFNKFNSLDIKPYFAKEDAPKEVSTRDVEEILNDLNGLIGLAEVKENVREILKYLDYSKKIDTEGFANLNMIFKGNSGTGKTTVARLLAELYYKLGFIRENKIIEVTSKDLIGSHLGETAPKTQAVIESALGGVLFIDEAYTIMASKGGSSSNYPAECIATICKAMELYPKDLVIIFAGYTKEMNEFINANQGLMSRIGYELEFPDFSKAELIQIFKDEVEGNEFTLEDGVLAKVEKIISKNKLGRNFGNARFVTNLFDRLVLTHAANYQDDNQLKVITNKDIDIYNETKKDKERGVDEILVELNSLIGLGKVKDTIDGFVSIIELNRKLDRMPDFNMHMIFKGNAGTGKTTVARLLAEIYYNLGYIKRNKLVEVQSQDLIGEFLGQTGPKTQSIIDSALDGVLFIDEAYSIMEHNGTNASYSAECVATLLKAMEDYQGRLIIIFAGYTEEMKKFRDLNPGLKSRIGYEIDFEDYSVEELVQIFEKKVYDKQFKFDEGAKKKVQNILRKAKEVENFGNGRFVENMVQRIIIEHAKNTRYIDDYERLLTFTEEDIPDMKAEESRKRIGF